MFVQNENMQCAKVTRICFQPIHPTNQTRFLTRMIFSDLKQRTMNAYDDMNDDDDWDDEYEPKARFRVLRVLLEFSLSEVLVSVFILH